MKIEQLLAQHFYNNKTVTLQGLGTFTLSPDFVLPMESDKETVMPENAISFHQDAKAGEDDDLINFIVQQTRKIKPLASADLDSYLTLGKQFLNIGKPFRIEGLGILEKNQAGGYDFWQGNHFNSKLEEAQTALKEKADDDISFASKKAAAPGISKKAILIIVGIVLAGLIAAATWYFAVKKTKTTAAAEPETTITQPVTEAADTTAKKPDSLSMKPATPVTAPSTDGYTFKVAIKITTGKESAIAKMNTLVTRGHKVIMYTPDSVTYFLAEPFNLPLSDTTKIKDSLNSFYYSGKAKVVVN